MEEALTLAHHAVKVVVVHRREELRASKVMRDRALAEPKIHFLWNTVITEYVGGDVLEAVRIQKRPHRGGEGRAGRGVFMAIGHKPNTDFLQGVLALNPQGYIVTHDFVETSMEGVFAAGDVHDPNTARR